MKNFNFIKTIKCCTVLFLLLQFSHLISQQAIINPHGDIKFDCEECHTSESWQIKNKQSFFDHSKTNFSLIGAHISTECASCHTELIFATSKTACIDCHTDIHKNELGINCENCHTPQNWENRQEIMKQHSLTRFPLIGFHAAVDCEACHFNQQRYEFKNTPIDCEHCHIENYKAATNPNHLLAKFDINCMDCHQSLPTTWKNVYWEHPQVFQLKGAHKLTGCIDCHSEFYTGISQECISCHEADYQSAIFPNHSDLGFPDDCSLCHDEQQWQGAAFDHLHETGFELRETHAGLNCIDCHVNNQISGLPTDCIGCHESNYNNAKNPDHLQGQYPHNCLVCHNETSWIPAQFDHNNTGFPLTGAHAHLACEDCHINGQFTQIPSDCWACHESDYTGVTEPNHAQNNFSQNCIVCHSTTAWTPAEFDHANTQFPLTGAHVPLDCIDCHSQGYTNTPTDCWSCHDSDFNNTTNPNHMAAGFPTDCETCHNTSNWNQTTWDHDSQYFPIYSGKHNNTWNTCDECHVDLNNYAVFECILCHEHNDKNKVDDDHSGVSNYVYASWACYDCHPDGVEKFRSNTRMRKAH